MNAHVRTLFDLRRFHGEQQTSPLVLVNGLAEQAESWFANRGHWRRHFDVKVPELLVYDGESLHRRIGEGGEITVGYLADRLAQYLDEFVQKPPYHLVGSSLGGQVILTYAARHPSRVDRLALLCPSGLHGDENLPMMEGVKRSQYDSLVKSVFHKDRFASEELVRAMERKFLNRRWKKGVLRTLRGTVGHSVAPLLPLVRQPCLLIWGEEDRILSDVPGSIRAAGLMPNAKQVLIRKCGHAPQIEKAKLVNQLVARFLRGKLGAIPASLDAARCLESRDRALPDELTTQRA